MASASSTRDGVVPAISLLGVLTSYPRVRLLLVLRCLICVEAVAGMHETA